MAALQWSVTTGAVALVPATAQSVLQVVAPSNQRLKILHITVCTDGGSSSLIPVQVQLVRQSSGGTWTSSPPSPRLVRKGLGETVQATVQWQATAEPTYNDILQKRTVPAYNGSLDLIYPFGQEVEVEGGGRLGIVCTATTTAVNVYVTVKAEE